MCAYKRSRTRVCRFSRAGRFAPLTGLEVRSKRVGGATYQVPIEVKRARQQNLAFRWLLEISRGRKGRPMAECLADELLQAYNREGATITKRENTHKMADANKMNAHFAW